VLALDVGSRTIGLAVTDPLGITAQGLETIRRKNKRTDLAALREVMTQYGVVEIVVGLPLRMSGAEGTQAEKMREFVAVLEKEFKVDAQVLRDLLALKKNPQKFSEAEAVNWHTRLFPVVDSVLVWIETNWPANGK